MIYLYVYLVGAAIGAVTGAFLDGYLGNELSTVPLSAIGALFWPVMIPFAMLLLISIVLRPVVRLGRSLRK